MSSPSYPSYCVVPLRESNGGFQAIADRSAERLDLLHFKTVNKIIILRLWLGLAVPDSNYGFDDYRSMYVYCIPDRFRTFISDKLVRFRVGDFRLYLRFRLASHLLKLYWPNFFSSYPVRQKGRHS